MDALAENGLRYNNFHVTPLCSPIRASLVMLISSMHGAEVGRDAHAPITDAYIAEPSKYQVLDGHSGDASGNVRQYLERSELTR